MDDDRIERALRAGPPDEPSFAPLAAARGREGRAAGSPKTRRSMPAGMLAMAAVAVTAVVVLAVIRIAPTLIDTGPGAPNLLTHLRADGHIGIAVTRGSPQVAVPNVGIDGFDIDVARAVADGLDLTPELHVVNPRMIEDEPWADAWDLAIDSAASTPERAARLHVGGPYYVRPGAVVVRGDLPATHLTDLDGSALCVVAGSLANRWLDGNLTLIDGTVAPPPANVTITTAVDADACQAMLDEGGVAGYVADFGPDVDLGGTGARRVLDEEPFRSSAAPAVDPARPGSTVLLDEVDRIVAGLRADGTLRELSERRFGGQDLSGPIGD